MDNKNNNIQIQSHFEQVHSIIHLHRSRALRVVNNESLFISWNVGQYVSEKLRSTEWGSKVVTQLAEYLRTKDPSLKGYSRSNIYNMVSFFETYSSDEFKRLLKSFENDHEFVQTNSAQLYSHENQSDEIVQTNSGQLYSHENQSDEIVQFQTGQIHLHKKIPEILTFINWTSHVEILNSCKLYEEKLFYRNRSMNFSPS